MKNNFLFLALIFSFASVAQTVLDTTFVDKKYREDQFYLSFNYNALAFRPKEINQYNFSRGYNLGFLRDFPLNQRRNLGIASGVGYSYNLIYTNAQTDGHKKLWIIPMDEVEKNYFEYHYIELTPVEFRWRGSTQYNHNFWRLYLGGKISFPIGAKYRKIADESIKIKGIELQNKVDFKMYIAAGKGTWNVFVQYGFSPFFYGMKDENGKNMQMRVANIGIIFYIL